MSSFRTHIDALVHAALEAANPERAVQRYLAIQEGVLAVGSERFALSDHTRIELVAIGKAATAMARGALGVLAGRVSGGLVVHPETEASPAGWPSHVQRLPGGHPLPNENSAAAGRALEARLADVVADDIVLVLISGGGSAMIELPAVGTSVQEIAAITRALQRAGADINELNCVRRVLSRVKGGGLLDLAGPARVVGMLLSDVMGDDPAVIASGPIVPSTTTVADAVAVLERYGLRDEIKILVNVRRKDSGRLTAAPAIIVGANALAAQAVQRVAISQGFHTRIVTDRLCGEASDAGRAIVADAIREQKTGATPFCLIYGGETTVTVRGSGRGGRNQELALSAACALEGTNHIVMCSFATDGIDGSSTAAGAIATGDTSKRAEALGLSAKRSLANNDSATFFAALGDAIVTGPTGTNVNDLVVALIGGPAS